MSTVHALAADPALDALVERVRAAAAAREPLLIRGGGTKEFYGNATHGEALQTHELAGIVAYEPSELVVTARAGTRLADLESVLAERRQMLAFEPPHFGPEATVGGCVAAGLAGPRRASAGPAYGGVRDFVLGARLLDGRARLLRFGGTVMKNVAGYDVARALAGSLGVLGVIVDVSLKVLPRPAVEATLQFEMNEASALGALNGWGGRPLPISATAWHGGVLHVRLSGAGPAVDAARRTLGGQEIEGAALWQDLREQRLPYFSGDRPLWRLGLPSAADRVGLGDETLIEWGGAQRWLRSDLPPPQIRARAAQLGGHATLFRGGDRSAGAFTPLAPTVAAIHRRLKAEFDPHAIFNRGRLYPEL